MAKFQNSMVKPILDTYFKLNENVLLVGPSGTGKTMVVREICGDAGHHLQIITGKESMQDIDMLGAYVPTEEGGTFKWVDGPLALAFQNASEGRQTVLLIDEINRMSSKHQNIFIEAINIYDDDYYMVHNPQTGQVLKAPRDKIQFIATANAGQAGLNEIPLALIDRLNLVFVDYPAKKTEISILEEIGIEQAIAAALVEFAGITREMTNQMELECGVSTRSLVQVSRQYAKLTNGDSMTVNKKGNLLMQLIWSPITQSAGVCNNSDSEWKERAMALRTQFKLIMEKMFQSHRGKTGIEKDADADEDKPSRSRGTGVGVGASPASI